MLAGKRVIRAPKWQRQTSLCVDTESITPERRPQIRTLLTLLILLIWLVLSASSFDQEPGAAIIQKSVEANERDWNAAPQFDYFEQDWTEHGSKTYEEIMILGSPYQRLVAIDGQWLSPHRQAEEERKLQNAISERRGESPRQRARRLSKYQAERMRDHAMLAEMSKAFDFQVVGEQTLDGRNVYLVKATPRPGYRPTSMQTHVLTGMHGKLWIDKETFQWVKVEAEVVQPVSIQGFLAKVEPGTLFELKKGPVSDGIWLATHFAMRSRAKVLFLFRHSGQEEESYFNYRPSKDY